MPRSRRLISSGVVLWCGVSMGLSASSVSVVGGGGRTRRLATTMGAMSAQEAYVPMRKEKKLFESLLRKEWLAPSVLEVVEYAKAGKMHRDLRREADGVYSFELFNEAFGRALLDEVDNYFAAGLPVRRPNSMNNYGLIVNEIGMKPALTQLQQEILLPISRLLFPEVSSGFHDHHSFMVQYRSDEDAGLDMHTDDSDVTFNVCLGEDFTGAHLTFCGMVGSAEHRQFSYAYAHEKGRAVVHLGTKRHGADDIEDGTRRNLIIWNHNREYRRSEAYSKRMTRYRKESGPPDERCLSFTHDRDYADFKEYREGTEQHAIKAWCPPAVACYDTMAKELKATGRARSLGTPTRTKKIDDESL